MSKVLSVCMAAYGEFDLLWSTLQGLRANHGDGFDIGVVDNAPQTDHRFRQAVAAVGGWYIHRPDLNGTSRPRDACFQFARTPWVMVCDAHVIFENDAIASAEAYCRQNPTSRDIISGPVVWDDGRGTATHWNPAPEAPTGLWGTWETGEAFNRLWNGGAGRAEIDATMEPFEIPMMGLGCFMMRKEAWPGFHHLFRGFGGEEGYIHEKVRQLGGKALCLPSLRWRHKFRDLGGWELNKQPYPSTNEAHVRNLLIGHCELGVEGYESLIRDKFGKKIDPKMFEAIAAEVREKVPFGKIEPAPKRQRLLGVWYSNNSAPESLLRKSLESIKVAADQSRHEVTVVTVPWKPVPGNPFPESLAAYKDGPGHLNIIRQIKQGISHVDSWWAHSPDGVPLTPPPFDAVCFLEHDVLYSPGYFDRIGDAFARHPSAPVVSHLDYIGLNATGWLKQIHQHEPMHQLAARTDVALVNLDRAEADCVKKGWAFIEPGADPESGVPTADREKWVRLQPDGFAPSVHVNH